VAYAALIVLFGASLFTLYVDVVPRLRIAIRRMQAAAAAAALGAVALSVAARAAIIGGQSMAHAAAGGTLATLLFDTLFGHASMLRFAAVLVFAGLLVRNRGTRDGALTLTGGIALASMAFTGHAVATAVPERYVHLASDSVHLLAAGAWIGALPPLALMLGREDVPADVAATVTQRFSRVGMLCVCLLIATGVVNASILVAQPSALIATAYGQVLLLKLLLFALMVVLAAVNRYDFTPKIATAPSALRGIARNAWIEAALGFAIALVVGALGVMVPAAHMGAMPPMHMH
jgi:putative copper resistance protein D